MTPMKDRKRQQQFEQWARHAMKGVKESGTFMQLHTPNFDPAKDPEYALQLGVAILLDRPIVILAPEGVELPPKLRAVAASVQYFVRDEPQSVWLAARRALEAIGVVKH